MRGELSETSAADLCRGLADAGATGVVEVDHPSGQGRVFFDAGHICWAESPAPRARLGARLVNAAILTSEELDGALSAQADADPPAKLGTLLVDRGLVGPDIVRVFVQEQILDALFELAGWGQGEFRFSPEGIPEDEVPVRLDVEDALADVARRAQEWAEIRRTVPDLDAAPALVSGSSSVAAALEPDEFAIMASVDGRRSVRELAADLGYGEFEAARLVHGLVVLGLVDLATAPAPTSPDLDVGAALDEAFAQRESAGPAPDGAAARPEVRVHLDPERLEPRRRVAQEPEPGTSDAPDPEPMAFGQEDPPPASADAEPTSPDVDLDDAEFDQLLEELAATVPDDGAEQEDGSRGPAEETADEPAAAAPAAAPTATDPATDPAAPPTAPEPATSPDEEAEDGAEDGAAPSPDAARTGRRRDGGGGDVSEFLRELSRLAVDEDEPRAQEPRRPSKDSAEPAPSSDDAPPSDRPDRPSRPSSPEHDDDDDKKKRGLFGWGR